MGEATIRDVAREARVSVASVSRTLNGLSNVHPDTRDKVLAAAKALRYVPHAGARSLSMSRTHALGVVIPDLHGEFFSELMRGLDREANARGYQLLLSSMHADADRAGHAMRTMRGRVDGLIVMAPQLTSDELMETLPASLPTVLVNSPAVTGRHGLGIDNAIGVDSLMAHLAAHGCRRIAHIAGPSGNLDAQDRRDSYVAALARILPSARPWIIEGDFSEQSGDAAASTFMRGDVDPPDAIFAANDMMALGALTRLRAIGVNVPGQIALVGFDDVPLARFIGLTTVDVRTDELGARAAARLIDQLAGLPAQSHGERITPSLVIRKTSGPNE